MLKSEVFGRDRHAPTQPKARFKDIASSTQMLGDYKVTLVILEMPFKMNMEPGERAYVGVRELDTSQGYGPAEPVPLTELGSAVLCEHFKRFLSRFPLARVPHDEAEYRRFLTIAFPHQTFSPPQ